MIAAILSLMGSRFSFEKMAPQPSSGFSRDASLEPVQVEPGRPSQRAKFPFDSRCPPRESIQTYKKGKTNPSVGLSHERTLCAKSISLAAASDYFLFWLIFAKAKIKKGISRSAERDSGLCPENPQTFEKV
ncbi:hypothetical protein [Butyricicoccus pullicaecorum]|uniref:hypothetical protein n=1 Tax=Butyricicoccus pullicaecorum TaxID=501571 RepID=UPI00399048BB